MRNTLNEEVPMDRTSSTKLPQKALLEEVERTETPEWTRAVMCEEVIQQIEKPFRDVGVDVMSEVNLVLSSTRNIV